MSYEWRTVEISSLCEGIFDGPHATPKKTTQGPIFLGISSLERGRLNLSNTEHLSEDDFNKWTKRVVPREGDIVFSYETRLGEVAMIPAGLRCCLGRRMALMRIDRTKALPEYVLYAYMAPAFQEVIKARTIHGSTVDRIPLTEFGSFPISIPCLQAQREITKILSVLDDRIALLRETNKTLESIAQALFKSWFVDFDPVRAKMEGRQPEGMDEETAALFPDSFELSEMGMVPKRWSYVSLKEVTAIFDSQRVPLSGPERAKRRGRYPYYGAATLMDWVDGYLFDGVYLLLGEDGSVTDGAGCPVTQYVWGKIWVNNHAHVLQGKAGVSTEHLMLALMKTNISPYITGAVQAKLSQSNMWRIPFLRPPNEVSIAFGDVVAPLFTSIRHNYEQAQTLSSLRDGLLPRLISGQLRLPESQEQVENVLS